MSRFKTKIAGACGPCGRRRCCAPAGAELAARPPDVGKFLAAHFPRWDRNHDGVLDLSEVHAVIEDHSTRGYEAAVIVVVGRRMSREEDQDHLSRAQLLALARDRSFQKDVSSTYKRLEKSRSRPLPAGRPRPLHVPPGPARGLLPAQPRRGARPQGPAEHPRDDPARPEGRLPGRLRRRPTGRGPALTDAELLLGARMDSRHGTWLAVIEKAYGLIREGRLAKKTGVRPDPGLPSPTRWSVRAAGRPISSPCSPAIAPRCSGNLACRAPSGRSMRRSRR